MHKKGSMLKNIYLNYVCRTDPTLCTMVGKVTRIRITTEVYRSNAFHYSKITLASSIMLLSFD